MSSDAGTGKGLDSRVVDYIKSHGDDLSFTDAFWKRCEPHPYELGRYPLYVDCLRLFSEGKSVAEIARMTGVNVRSVRSWILFEEKPKLAHFLGIYLRLGVARDGWVWLSINNTPGHAIPLGPIIKVPMSVCSWSDVATVLAQLKPLRNEERVFSREFLFGFLTGMIIGDAAKSKIGNWHRHLGLVLSKKYSTNERIGQFTCLCSQGIGLRMHRVSDQPKPEHKPHGFYEWISQASPLVDWIFNVCLGLKDGERTTYDAVRMDWVLDSPEDFRQGLVQGIAESDGSVSVASQTVEFWIGPNWDFFKGVLLSFGVKSFRNREALSVTKNQISNLSRVPPFSPFLRTARFMRFEKLSRARHVGHGKRVPAEIRAFIMENRVGLSVPQLSEQVLDKFGVVLTFEAVQRWSRKGLNQSIAHSNA